MMLMMKFANKVRLETCSPAPTLTMHIAQRSTAQQKYKHLLRVDSEKAPGWMNKTVIVIISQVQQQGQAGAGNSESVESIPNIISQSKKEGLH